MTNFISIRAVRRSSVLSALTLLACLTATSPGVAQTGPEPDEASVDARGRELYDNGARLFAEGQYEDAIIAWNEGYRVTSEPAFLFNVASAHERIGNFTEAIEVLNTYRAFATSDEQDALDRRIRALQERVDSEALPDSQESDETTNDGPDGATETIVDPRNGENTETDTNGESEPVVEPSETERSGLTVPQTLLVSTAATGAGLAIAFGARAIVQSSQANERCVTTLDNSICDQHAEPHFDAAQSSAVISDIGLGVAIISTVALIISAVGRDNEDEQVDAQDNAGAWLNVAPSWVNGGAGIELRGQF